MALVPLLVSLVRVQASGRAPTLRALYRGFAAGFVYFAGTLYWLADVMVTFGGLAYPLAVLAALLLVAYLALFPAIFAAVVVLSLGWLGRPALWLAPLAWIATEYARGHALTGFPWVPLGNSQIDTTGIAQVASVVGVYGLSGLVVAVSSALVYVVTGWTGEVTSGRRPARWRRLLPLAILALVVAAIAIWGQWRVATAALTRQGSPVRIGLAQGNVPQGQKWDPAFAGTIVSRYLSQTREAAAQGARLVVWPESSTPFAFEADPAGAALLQRLARETDAWLLIGSDQIEPGPPPRYYNSAYMLTPAGAVSGVYRKMHLVPFGEYVPFQNALFFVGPLVESVGGFSAGETLTIFTAAGGTLSTAICYEAVFPELGREAVERGSQLLSTITNDAWYGRSSAPWQHFDQARMRTIEQGRYLIRAANTGISGIVDPYGRVVSRTRLFEEKVVVGDVRFLDGQTVYARIGDAVAFASLAFTGLVITRGVVKRRR